MYEIEKNVPVPPRRGTRRGKYPWHDIGIGDSFVIPNKSTKQALALTGWPRKALGHKYTVRSDGNGGTRIWRIE